MPYITPEVKTRIRENYKAVLTPGQLNFAITDLVMRYLGEKPWSYGEINTIIGVLEAAKLEFYRRVAAPYEDGKRWENGDVYKS